MLEWLAPAVTLAEEELPCLLVARDGRVLESSAGATRLVGPLEPDARLSGLFNLDDEELRTLLAARGRWTGSCGLTRPDGLRIGVRLVAHAGHQDLLLFVLVDLAPLTELQEELGGINSRLTNLNRDRAKEAAKLVHALAENERQARILMVQKEELEVQADELQAANQELAMVNRHLEDANRELLERDRAKMQFYANMSHELRAPLNSIIGFTEDALDGVAGPLTPTQTKFLENVMASSRHLLHVATEMLDLAKLQSGRAALALDDVDLEGLLAELGTVMAPMIKRKCQTLVVADAAGIGPIKADRAKLFQILLNLATNAHKYTPVGGHVAVDVACDGQRLQLAVRDNGVGIAPEDQPQIFEEYRQAVAAAEGADRQGTGLGLAIARRLVELHGGAITLESAPGKGSTFTVVLPTGGPA